MEPFALRRALDNVRATTPLVHNITNYVTVNDCANALLAIGASPIMSDEPADVADILEQLDPQQRRLKRQPCRQRAERRRHTVGGRAADDERQPKRRRTAIDLPGPQCRAAEQRRPLPQQRRAARAGQQLLCVDR